MSRIQIDTWQRRRPTLHAVCDVRNVLHRAWLEWLGFTQRGHLDAFGAAGRPFDLYSHVHNRALHLTLNLAKDPAGAHVQERPQGPPFEGAACLTIRALRFANSSAGSFLCCTSWRAIAATPRPGCRR
jgi:hypothetical protein